MKLTDENVAKALGWKNVRQPYSDLARCWTKGDPFKDGLKEPPAFTTSLDVIVDEIEARGLWWSVARIEPRAVSRGYLAHIGPGQYSGGTPALALCAALLAYIKEQP